MRTRRVIRSSRGRFRLSLSRASHSGRHSQPSAGGSPDSEPAFPTLNNCSPNCHPVPDHKPGNDQVCIPVGFFRKGGRPLCLGARDTNNQCTDFPVCVYLTRPQPIPPDRTWTGCFPLPAPPSPDRQLPSCRQGPQLHPRTHMHVPVPKSAPYAGCSHQ